MNNNHKEGSDEFAWLNYDEAKIVGPAKSLAVGAGDSIKMDVYPHTVARPPSDCGDL